MTNKTRKDRRPDENSIERACLRCREKFLSLWKGNRLCDKCRSYANRHNNIDAQDRVQTGGRHGRAD